MVLLAHFLRSFAAITTVGLLQIPSSVPLNFSNPLAYDPLVCPPTQPNLTNGQKIPPRRPRPLCRTFNSTYLEAVLKEIKPRFQNSDLATLFENALTLTLDTTIRWYDPQVPLTFPTTGQFPHGWLRNATHQLNVYLPFMHHDSELQKLALGFINFLSGYITNCYKELDFYQLDERFAQSIPFSKSVISCDLPLADTAEFLSISMSYYQSTGDSKFMTQNWIDVVERILSSYQGLGRQFISNLNFSDPLISITFPKNETVHHGLLMDAINEFGDKVSSRANVPINCLIATQTQRAALFLKDVANNTNLASKASQISQQIRQAVEKQAVVKHPVWGLVYAYEVDPYGSRAIMDDARVPSLLSLPYFGYTGLANPIYLTTRKMILSPKGNPYLFHGQQAAGIGSPSTVIPQIWPMSLVSKLMSSESDYEIRDALNTLLITAEGHGYISQTFNAHRKNDYTKPYYAWANSYFAEAILYLAEKKPHLIFSDGRPYQVSIRGNLANYGALGQQSPNVVHAIMTNYNRPHTRLIYVAGLLVLILLSWVFGVKSFWRKLKGPKNKDRPYMLLKHGD
ncbi:hypothetical protein O181_081983 [Austropuccinia psidii MF-1]|uniref:Glycoside hydrolase family 125 protein n=2 Tax=Austropuccinia psidii MF-1 TaxID=1389203 RepID=A0A9Q3FLM0_9BASI|nr:hypothetical protein [Austropuccinia psidii MF-1]